jgi:hypothetical protein
MRTLLVGYDLKQPGRDYEPLYAKLRSQSSWWHALDSTWMVRTESTPLALRDELSALVDANDVLLVMDVTNDPAAWRNLPKDASDWILKWWE